MLNDFPQASKTLLQLKDLVQLPAFILFQKEIDLYIQSQQAPTNDFVILFNKNRLSDTFAALKLSTDSKLKLAFSFPVLRPPNMIPSVDESVVQSEFSLK